MRKNKGITLVSLVVTIIVLIILAGVSINLTLGKNGIITKAKQAKENIELAKVEEETTLNELYTQIETEGGVSGEVSHDAIAKLSEFKKSIADAIEEAGGVKPEYTANSTRFGDSIKGIVAEVTKLDDDVAATAEDIAEGKQAWVNGEKIIGTLSISSNVEDIINKPRAVIVGVGYVEANVYIYENNSNVVRNNDTCTARGFTAYRSNTETCYIKTNVAGTYLVISNSSMKIVTVTSNQNTTLVSCTPSSAGQNIGVHMAIRLSE